MKEFTITKDQIKELSDGCCFHDRVLKDMFPEAFKELVIKPNAVYQHSGGNIYKIIRTSTYGFVLGEISGSNQHYGSACATEDKLIELFGVDSDNFTYLGQAKDVVKVSGVK